MSAHRTVEQKVCRGVNADRSLRIQEMCLAHMHRNIKSGKSMQRYTRVVLMAVTLILFVIDEGKGAASKNNGRTPRPSARRLLSRRCVRFDSGQLH